MTAINAIPLHKSMKHSCLECCIHLGHPISGKGCSAQRQRKEQWKLLDGFIIGKLSIQVEVKDILMERRKEQEWGEGGEGKAEVYKIMSVPEKMGGKQEQMCLSPCTKKGNPLKVKIKSLQGIKKIRNVTILFLQHTVPQHGTHQSKVYERKGSGGILKGLDICMEPDVPICYYLLLQQFRAASSQGQHEIPEKAPCPQLSSFNCSISE